MVNASTPATYVPLYVPQAEIQAQELVTDTGIISTGSDFLLLNAKNGLQLTGEANTSTVHFYGVNDTSTNLPDALLTVSNGIPGATKGGTVTFDSTHVT